MELSLKEIAEVVGGLAQGDPDWKISGTAPFERAGEKEITLAGTPAYWKNIDRTGAGAVIVPPGVPCGDRNRIETGTPQVAFTILINLFAEADGRPSEPGISPRACIGRNFTCGRTVRIAPTVVISDNVSLGERVVLHPGVFLGDGVTIGHDVIIHANVAILNGSIIGSRVTIQAGSVIGSDGFGYTRDGDRYLKITHTGFVQIDDDVEIGAGNTIDRGTFDKTHIRSGVKTDNLVHIAHNVTIGENTIIVAQTGIAGSVTIGRNVILAGQAGIAGHLTIGDRATIGPQAGIVKSVSAHEVVSGTPGIPHQLWLKAQSLVPRLPAIKKSLKDLEKRVAALENKLKGKSSDENRHQ